MPVFKFPKLKLAAIIAPIAIIITIVIIAVSLRVCIIKIGVDQVGVKTVVWGVKRGIIKRDFRAGWHRNIPGTVQWEVYDSTVQTLEMTEEHSGSFGHDQRDVLKVRTKDDYDVSVDLIVKYRIRKGEAWALKRDIGSTERYKMIVENEARDIARGVFGKMGELDLYNPYEKRKRALEGREMHNKRLKKRHVEIIDWLILDIRFDPGLDRKIKSIKVAELEELLNISKGMAAEQRGITQTIDAETEAVALEIGGDKKRKLTVMEAQTANRIIEIMANANRYMVEKKAQGDRYKAEQIAAGTFLNAKANADGEKLRRNAMRGMGGNMIVAIEAAKNLNLADLLISTQDVDLLNIDNMVSKLGAEKEKELIGILEKIENEVNEEYEDVDLSQPLTDTEKLSTDNTDINSKEVEEEKIEGNVGDNHITNEEMINEYWDKKESEKSNEDETETGKMEYIP